jgi:2-oxoglutarate dehydrogenase E2 component (dihydrolipoamide succinyltransferase)
MEFELILPKMGESVAEATIVKWLKQPGDFISEDEVVVEIATDKVDSEVPSPVSGTLISHRIQQDEVAAVGAVIAVIRTEGQEQEPLRTAPEQTPQSDPDPVPFVPAAPEAPAVQASQSSFGSGSRFYSPLVRSIAAEEGISSEELDNIQGSGSEGRVTKTDILNYLEQRKAAPLNGRQHHTGVAAASPDAETAPLQTAATARPAMASPEVIPGAGDEIIEMDRMRRLISDHMLMSKQVSPHVTSFVEADVTNLVRWRERVKGVFEKREGQKITYTPVFVQAVARAIKEMPMINVSVKGNQIIRKRDINIGMAAALPSGNLIVPVIRNADQLNLVGLAKAVNDLALRARGNKLQPDEVKDGTFTITNIGTFGNIMGTPIINQPQVAILAIGAIQKKPAVIETEHGDVIAIRHKMYLSMSYDHRVVDGSLGGMFLKRVADLLEAWDVNEAV